MKKDFKESGNNIIDESEKELHNMVSAFADVTRGAINKTSNVINKNVNTIYCSNCGTKITKDSIYCKHCGKKINKNS